MVLIAHICLMWKIYDRATQDYSRLLEILGVTFTYYYYYYFLFLHTHGTEPFPQQLDKN